MCIWINSTVGIRAIRVRGGGIGGAVSVDGVRVVTTHAGRMSARCARSFGCRCSCGPTAFLRRRRAESSFTSALGMNNAAGVGEGLLVVPTSHSFGHPESTSIQNSAKGPGIELGAGLTLGARGIADEAGATATLSTWVRSTWSRRVSERSYMIHGDYAHGNNNDGEYV